MGLPHKPHTAGSRVLLDGVDVLCTIGALRIRTRLWGVQSYTSNKIWTLNHKP